MSPGLPYIYGPTVACQINMNCDKYLDFFQKEFYTSMYAEKSF